MQVGDSAVTIATILELNTFTLFIMHSCVLPSNIK